MSVRTDTLSSPHASKLNILADLEQEMARLGAKIETLDSTYGSEGTQTASTMSPPSSPQKDILLPVPVRSLDPSMRNTDVPPPTPSDGVHVYGLDGHGQTCLGAPSTSQSNGSQLRSDRGDVAVTTSGNEIPGTESPIRGFVENTEVKRNRCGDKENKGVSNKFEGRRSSSSLRKIQIGFRKKKKFKILVVGNSKCGKTSIINRYVHRTFTDEYRYTVGCDFSTKTVKDEKTGEDIRLQLWDIAGQDRFIQMTRPFFRNAFGAVVVCDVARIASIDAACEWKAELDRCLDPKQTGYRVPVILIANKVDTLTDVHESFKIGAYVQKNALSMKFDGWFIGSAKKDERIEDAMKFLIDEIKKQQNIREEKRKNKPKSPLKGMQLTAGDGMRSNSDKCVLL